MPKGIFSQTFCVLTSREISIEEIAGALKGFEILGYPAESASDWQFSGPSLVLSYRPEVNGKVSVDVVDHRWPDSMGDTGADKITFGAWGTGHFGPFTYPESLLRAGQHSWSWKPGRTIVNSHTGFIRIRASYVFGGGGDSPVLPKDYRPAPELEFLTKVVLALLELPGTLCYFNPGGEVLRDKESLQELLKICADAKAPALPAWCNVRFFKLSDEWFLMDTVGNSQLDVPDLEVVFPTAEYQPPQIDGYLRDVSMYFISEGPDVLKVGDKIDGPGESDLSWQVDRPENPLVDPPRRFFRLLPSKHQGIIDQMKR